MKIPRQIQTSLKVLTPLALALAGEMTMGGTAAQALQINFTYNPGIEQTALAGFEQAAQLWEDLFLDPVTVNIDIDFKALDQGILGETYSTQQQDSYTRVFEALANDPYKTEADKKSISSLPSGSAFNLWLNYTENNPHGEGSAQPYLDNDGDANNTNISMTTANAKALGLFSGNTTDSDASISFSNLFDWDFNRNDGIAATAFDFVGIAAHEIGHALGFISGVDILDLNSPNNNGDFFNDDQFTYVSPLDLFRLSGDSFADGQGAIDFTADTTPKFFSINRRDPLISLSSDGSVDKIALFSTGETHGDGWQASHWKDNLGLGLMDPTFSYGELGRISNFDKLAFDVIGWDLKSTPEPTSTGSLLAIGGLGVGLWLKTQQQQKVHNKKLS